MKYKISKRLIGLIKTARERELMLIYQPWTEKKNELKVTIIQHLNWIGLLCSPFMVKNIIKFFSTANIAPNRSICIQLTAVCSIRQTPVAAAAAQSNRNQWEPYVWSRNNGVNAKKNHIVCTANATNILLLWYFKQFQLQPSFLFICLIQNKHIF